MPDARSPIWHHLVLYRRDPEQGKARFFSLTIERDLFGTIRLVRNWRPVDSKGQEQVEIFSTCAGRDFRNKVHTGSFDPLNPAWVGSLISWRTVQNQAPNSDWATLQNVRSTLC
jgi:predicted DNA-binding WGR domain protein